MKKMRTAALGGVLALSASLLVACGDAPDEENGSGAKAESGFKPCIVSDDGGFDDKSFNQLSYEGLVQAADEFGIEHGEFESTSENDYASALESFVSDGCTTIVTVGFALAAATVDSAKANEDINYILIDDGADTDFDGKKDAENIKPLLYDTAQAAFLAGYAAADYTKTGVVGTYGGQPYPTVTIFMDGFKQGVDHYNKTKGKDVKVVGWQGNDKGVFTGGFAANNKATQAAQQLIDADADVILPVGGPIYQGALTAFGDSDKDLALVGTDADLFESDPKTQDVVFTSVLKGLKISTYEAVKAAGEGKFDPEAYIGTLENDGVGVADFHNFSDKVSDSLQGELDDLKKQIVAGDIKVNSYLNN